MARSRRSRSTTSPGQTVRGVLYNIYGPAEITPEAPVATTETKQVFPTERFTLMRKSDGQAYLVDAPVGSASTESTPSAS